MMIFQLLISFYKIIIVLYYYLAKMKINCYIHNFQIRKRVFDSPNFCLQMINTLCIKKITLKTLYFYSERTIFIKFNYKMSKKK